jgi:RimJ/RimL family protein N-acetyltransferase
MLTLPLKVASCEVRSWRLDDATSIACHANNRKIWLNLRDVFPHPYGPEDAVRFLDFAVRQSTELSFCIACKGKPIGGIGLRPGSDVESFSAEIGYWLGEAYWNRGIATAAVKAMTPHGFDMLGLHRIFALPYSRNLASLRTLEKARFAREGLLRESAFTD